jgi:hypothetical protein
LVEQATENRCVGGSIPPLGTTLSLSVCGNKRQHAEALAEIESRWANIRTSETPNLWRQNGQLNTTPTLTLKIAVNCVFDSLAVSSAT